MENIFRLQVLTKALDLAQRIYKTTNDFPKSEVFGLTSQIRRAAVSIMANIAEAAKRKTKKDKANFFTIADGSAEELKALLYLSYKLEYITKSQCENLLNEIRIICRMIYRYSQKLTT